MHTANATHVHIPTGKKCSILNCGGHRRVEQSFCDFGENSEPFTWVYTEDLRPIEAKAPRFYFDRVSLVSASDSFEGLAKLERIDRFWFDDYEEARLACDRAFVAALPHERVTILTCL